MENLENLLNDFDLFYEFSDDQNKYDKHSKLERLIKEEIKKLGIKKTIQELKNEVKK